ncbi:MAG: hypothetical protein K6A92_09545 [Lachnospiraceae bacterium]|nr:hypothetical protein [Lachnospiraceae bacterium]
MSIHIPNRTNYSTLFSSLPGYKNGINANVSSLSSLLSDYSSIKTGSYGKLMKAYYGEVATKAKTTKSNTSTKDTTKTEAETTEASKTDTSKTASAKTAKEEESAVSKLASSYTPTGVAAKNAAASGLFDTSI